jgi:nucleoside-diphosphate-sugar epimerase
MKVAVTGGTGCLGTPIIEKLIQLGVDIKLLALPGDSVAQKIGKKLQVVSGSLSSLDVLMKLTKDCEVVFHLAGKAHVNPKIKCEYDEFYHVNVEGTRNLVRACIRSQVKRMIFFSTVSVYGKDGDFHGDECSLCEPVSVYAKSKHLAEKIVLNSEKKGGPKGIVLRFPVAYGPLDRGNVLRLIKAINKKQFFYFGDGRCSRSMISNRNAAEAAINAALGFFTGDGVFCVTDGRDYQLQELVNAICVALRTSWRPWHVPVYAAKLMGKVGDFFENITRISSPINSSAVRKLSSHLTFSCEKAKRLLRYEPTETLSEGISREIEWFQKKVKNQP